MQELIKYIEDILLEIELSADDVGNSVEDNGYAFGWSRGEKYADIEIFTNGDIVAVMFIGLEIPIVKPVKQDELKDILIEIKNFIL